MEHARIEIDQYVLYVPTHAQNNLQHEAVEKGIVMGKNAEYVFVRFGGDWHSKACRAQDLR